MGIRFCESVGIVPGGEVAYGYWVSLVSMCVLFLKSRLTYLVEVPLSILPTTEKIEYLLPTFKKLSLTLK